MSKEDLRAVAIEIAWQMYGTPYIWAGDDTIAGFDCSGMYVEILKSVGRLPLKGDWAASGLWNKFILAQVYTPEPGSLVFWENAQGRIRHVEMCIGHGLSIGASGGGRNIQDTHDDDGKLIRTALQAAIEHNAFVKVRPIEGRGHIRGFLDPFKEG